MLIGVSPGPMYERCYLRLSESNPMLGHRGVRLGLSYPEIYEMQVEAILRAAHNLYPKTKECNYNARDNDPSCYER
jgi:phosphoenolpyruvate synthase/pyruvate phosphate dikinase